MELLGGLFSFKKRKERLEQERVKAEKLAVEEEELAKIREDIMAKKKQTEEAKKKGGGTFAVQIEEALRRGATAISKTSLAKRSRNIGRSGRSGALSTLPSHRRSATGLVSPFSDPVLPSGLSLPSSMQRSQSSPKRKGRRKRRRR